METRNLCAQVPLSLHTRVCEERERAGLTTAQYITNLLTEYYDMKENGGMTIMAKKAALNDLVRFWSRRATAMTQHVVSCRCAIMRARP